MNIGIIGSGNVGRTLGELWAKAGHHVMFSFASYPELKSASVGFVQSRGQNLCYVN